MRGCWWCGAYWGKRVRERLADGKEWNSPTRAKMTVKSGAAGT